MTPEKLAELESAATAAANAAADAGGTDEALNKAATEAKAAFDAAKTPPNPVATELEREQKRNQRTEKEKAEYSLKMNAKRLQELGGNPAEILGVREASQEEDVDDVPDWYRKEKSKEAQRTALQLADDIPDEADRNLVKEYLSKRIVPSGNAQDDFRLALSAVMSLKNKQVVEEISRRTAPRVTAAGGSLPAKVEDQFTPTQEEAIMMAPPYNVSKEKIIEARRKQGAAAS